MRDVAETYDEQAHLWPLSGVSGFRDGDALGANVAHDLPKSVNNLGRRVTKPVNQVTSISPSYAGRLEQTLHTSSREIYMGQTKVKIDRAASRQAWVAGIEGTTTGAQHTIITAVTAYLSLRPYLGPPGPDDAFASSYLGAGKVSRSPTFAGIDTAGTTYLKVVDTVTGFTSLPLTTLGDVDSLWLILTVTGYNSGAAGEGKARCYDFCLWSKPD